MSLATNLIQVLTKNYQLIKMNKICQKLSSLLLNLKFTINSNKKNKVDMPQKPRVSESNIPPLNQYKIYSNINQDFNKYTVVECIQVIPVSVIGRSGNIYIAHVYYINKWGIMFISFPGAKSEYEYFDMINTNGAMVEQLGSLFVHNKNPGLDPRRLINVVDPVQKSIVKEYCLNYLSYLVKCRKMQVIHGKLYKTSKSDPGLGYMFYWVLDSDDINPQVLMEYLDYDLAVESIQPHRDLSADALFRKIFEDAYSANRYKIAFEKSIREFKKQDSILYQSTKVLLLEYKTHFGRFSSKFSNEFSPSTTNLDTNTSAKAQKVNVGDTRALPQQVTIVARNFKN